MLISFVFPLTFVVLWASAFATGSVATQDATPFAALAFRFSIVAVGFFIVAWILSEFSRIDRHDLKHSVITGLLFHGLYLGGCWYSFSVGIPAGVSALIVCTQPILTAIFAGLLLGEHVSLKNWVGLSLGFVGAALVLGVDFGDEFALDGLIANVIALGSITTATIWQRKFSQTLPLATNNALQAASAALFHGIVMWFLETPSIELTLTFGLAMGWQIVAVSFGAFTILMYLINHNSASQTSALFFLVPPIAAVMGWMLLNEGLTTLDMIGFTVASTGVYLATRRPKERLGGH
jgi:drug/metabolite transporter (DMT)-like permease